MAAGMARGGKLPGPWWAKALGVVIGGGLGVGAADYGYELQLDLMNKAGTSKKFLQNSDSQIKQLIGNMIPERLTFGPEGINRPNQGERVKSAVKDMLIDGAVSSAFFGVRPLYIGAKQFLGGNVFGMFKSYLYTFESSHSNFLITVINSMNRIQNSFRVSFLNC